MRVHRRSLRWLRECRGLNALELAEETGCAVGTIVRAEMGLQVPIDQVERTRLAAAYGLEPEEFVRLALDAADAHERRV
ncbi:MAG: helix-turn-helix transcriptional regulator [Planctomycetota bacterium]